MPTDNPLRDLSNQLARAVRTGAQSVVAVHGRPHVPSSGIFWQPGVVVTTDHTLKRESDLTIAMPDGASAPATLAGRDSGTDIAVLKVAGDGANAPKRADEASIETGSLVFALGRRADNSIGASFGVIAATGGDWRTWRGGHIERFISPGVDIYTGFSGGALVDAEGSLIGLNTSALTRGSGVTIPAVTVSRVVADLLATGRVRRGYLGIGMHPVQLPDGREGLIILTVEKDGPADKAGLLVGDILLTLEGQPVTDTDEIQSHLGGDRVGKAIATELSRGGTQLRLEIVPAERRARKCH